MGWYRVVKTIKGHRYEYEQRTWREGRKVRTESRYIGPATPTEQPEPVNTTPRIFYYYRVMKRLACAAAGNFASSRGIAAGSASARGRDAGARWRSRPGCAVRGARDEFRGR